MNNLNINKRIINLREKRNWTQRELAKRIGINVSVMNRIESGERPIKDLELDKLASVFNTTTDYLLGRTDNELPKLTNKEEKDIAKDLQKIINNLSTDGYAQFDGRSIDELDDEDRELLLASLENSMKFAKRLAKQKKKESE